MKLALTELRPKRHRLVARLQQGLPYAPRRASRATPGLSLVAGSDILDRWKRSGLVIAIESMIRR
jgi:hypothetical protein